MHGIYRHSNNCTCSILFFGHCTQRMHLHPGISPLAARSCLAARATDSKIRLWRIKHRRVQTAAVGSCRGVYVFVGRVEPVLRLEMCHMIHAEMLSRLFMGFSAGCFSLSRPLCSVNLSLTNFARKTTSRGTIPPHNLKLPSRAL